MSENDPAKRRPPSLTESGIHLLAQNKRLIILRNKLNNYLKVTKTDKTEAAAIRIALPLAFLMDINIRADQKTQSFDQETELTTRIRMIQKIGKLGYNTQDQILYIWHKTADIYEIISQNKLSQTIYRRPGVFDPKRDTEPASSKKKKVRLPSARGNSAERKYYAFIDPISLRNVSDPKALMLKAEKMFENGLKDLSPEKKKEWERDIIALLEGKKLPKSQTKDWLKKQQKAINLIRKLTPIN